MSDENKSGNDSIQKTLVVALVLCVVCSVVVSMAAVMLRPAQVANKERDLKRNILEAAGMYNPEQSVEEQFSRFSVRIVDLDSGTFTDAVDADSYDQLQAAKDPNMSEELADQNDIAGISRLEKYAKVYTVEADDGSVETLILPIRGYGLWGTLYGFIALEADIKTVIGLGFYDHKETPGLGGEVDNPKWKDLWHGKKVYDDSGEVAISVIKGSVDRQSDPRAEYKVDGLSGATLTTRGVDNLLKFWMGENGFANFLDNLREGDA